MATKISKTQMQAWSQMLTQSWLILNQVKNPMQSYYQAKNPIFQSLNALIVIAWNTIARTIPNQIGQKPKVWEIRKTNSYIAITLVLVMQKKIQQASWYSYFSQLA